LPAEDVRLLLPDSEVTNFELLYGNDRLEENREESEDHPESWSGREIFLSGRNSERASISYQVKLSDRFPLEKHSYGDGRRCILYPFEILPNFEERESRSNVSFQLPPAWVVITTAKKVGKGFSSVGNKLEEVFYLGKASSQQLSHGQTEIALAVEAAWEPSKEMVLDILRQQILYQEKIVKEGKSRSLLVALVESPKSVGELRFSTLNNSSGFSASAPFSPWNPSEFQEALRRGVSKCLLECFFPSLRFAKRSTLESYVLEYFLKKSDLKRGLLPKEKFLQQIAEVLK